MSRNAVKKEDLLPFNKKYLDNIGKGKVPKGFPQLPTEELLMISRISSIESEGGKYGNGYIAAEFDLGPDSWFFRCRSGSNSSMPGSLGVEGLCQLLEFYLGLLGNQGSGIALKLGYVRFLKHVTPEHSSIQYRLHIKSLIASDYPYAIADGEITVGTEIATTASGIMVGLKPEGKKNTPHPKPTFRSANL